MKKVVILTASFGMGHNSVAVAIRDQIEEYAAEFKVEIIDAFELLTPKMKSKYEKLYKILTDKYPKLYNCVYSMRKETEDTIFDSMFYEMHKGKLHKYLESEQPEMIISTFPLCSGIVSKIKKKLSRNIPMVTVVTDVVDSWEWLHQDTDMYFVPSVEIKHKLMEKEISGEKIKVTGIPVRKEFLVASDRKNKRKQILIMASAMNNMGITQSVLKRVDALGEFQVTIVTGSNEKLYDQLSSIAYKNIKILGYTTEMSQLMDASDFIVTKPGGVTLFEAINMEIPLIVKDSGIGQEQANIQYVKENEIGYYLDASTDIVDIFEQDLIDDKLLTRMRRNLRKIKNTIQPNKIAEYSLEVIS